MEQGLFYEVSGMLASVAMILGYLPQAIQTIRTVIRTALLCRHSS